MATAGKVMVSPAVSRVCRAARARWRLSWLSRARAAARPAGLGGRAAHGSARFGVGRGDEADASGGAGAA